MAFIGNEVVSLSDYRNNEIINRELESIDGNFMVHSMYLITFFGVISYTYSVLQTYRLLEYNIYGMSLVIFTRMNINKVSRFMIASIYIIIEIISLACSVTKYIFYLIAYLFHAIPQINSGMNQNSTAQNLNSGLQNSDYHNTALIINSEVRPPPIEESTSTNTIGSDLNDANSRSVDHVTIEIEP